MLFNLRAEYARKNINPYKGIMKALGCSEKTARNKLNESSPTTIPEALAIRETNFSDENFSLEYLFATDNKNA